MPAAVKRKLFQLLTQFILRYRRPQFCTKTEHENRIQRASIDILCNIFHYIDFDQRAFVTGRRFVTEVAWQWCVGKGCNPSAPLLAMTRINLLQFPSGDHRRADGLHCSTKESRLVPLPTLPGETTIQPDWAGMDLASRYALCFALAKSPTAEETQTRSDGPGVSSSRAQNLQSVPASGNDHRRSQKEPCPGAGLIYKT